LDLFLEARSCSLLSALISALCSPLSLLSVLCCWESESKALLGNCFFVGQWLLSALWSLLFAAGRPGRLGSSFSQLKALLGNCF
jgi:hypothetical protein